MNKTKLAIAIDSIAITLIFFILSFFWIRRYIKSAILLVFICIFISFFLFIAIFRYFLKKYNLTNLSIKESKHISKCIESLKFSPSNKYISYFEDLLKAKYIFDNCFENNQYIFYINIRQQLTSYDFFKALDIYYKNNKIIIFICENFNTEFKALIENKINFFQIFSIPDLYKLMKQQNKFPENQDNNLSLKEKFKNKIQTFIFTLTKRHFKDYFFSGLSLIALSFFIPYSIYYSIFGSALLILSILCLFKSKNNDLINSKNNITLLDSIKK